MTEIANKFSSNSSASVPLSLAQGFLPDFAKLVSLKHLGPGPCLATESPTSLGVCCLPFVKTGWGTIPRDLLPGTSSLCLSGVSSSPRLLAFSLHFSLSPHFRYKGSNIYEVQILEKRNEVKIQEL